jgi:hypothetical protein
METLQSAKPSIQPDAEKMAPEAGAGPDINRLMERVERMLAQSRTDSNFGISGNIETLENSISSWLRQAPPWFAELNAGKLMEISFNLETAKIERALNSKQIDEECATLMLDDLVLNASSRLDPALLINARQLIQQKKQALASIRQSKAKHEVEELNKQADGLLKQNPSRLDDPVKTYQELVEILEQMEEVALFYPAAKSAMDGIKGSLAPFYDAALQKELQDAFRLLEGQFHNFASGQWHNEVYGWLGVFENEGRPIFLKHEADQLKRMVNLSGLRLRLDAFEKRMAQDADRNLPPDIAMRTNSMAMSEACSMLLEARTIGPLSRPEQQRIEAAYKRLEAQEKDLLESAQKNHAERLKAYNRWAVSEINTAKELQRKCKKQVGGFFDSLFDVGDFADRLSRTTLEDLYKLTLAPGSLAADKPKYSSNDYHNDLVLICNLLNTIDLAFLDKPVLDFYHLIYEEVKQPLNEEHLHRIAINSLETEKKPLQQGGQAQ